jgi:hypothetical protein
MHCGYERESLYSNIVTRYFVQKNIKEWNVKDNFFKHEIHLNKA